MIDGHSLFIAALLLIAGLWAGLQNALAGGGSFVTLPALILAGLPPIAANVTSTVALFPSQLAMGFSGRKQAAGTGQLSLGMLVLVSLVGGAAGGLLLINTSPDLFARLVPWLVLAATVIFIWGNFIRKSGAQDRHIGLGTTYAAQFAIAIYGGYFGGGVGILMMAALGMAGLSVRIAGATKNVLAGVMNASAVALFVMSPLVDWHLVVPLGIGAIIGGVAGAWALQRVNETALKVAVACIGLALSVGLFLRPI